MIKKRMRCPCKECEGKPYEINHSLVELLFKLELKLRERGLSLIINSGKRCPAYNASVGGYANSPHIFGKAADIKVEGMSILELAKICAEIGFSRIGIYPNHVHVDVVRPYPSRYWYVAQYESSPIYSGKEYDFEKFIKKVR